jgi:hypothetical protein
MAQSITRWNVSAQVPLKSPCETALTPYVTAGDTDGIPILTFGPESGIPVNEYICTRTWITSELAQNWLDNIDGIAAGVGAVCLEKTLVP